MNNYRDPGYRFFEPSNNLECVECREITHEYFTIRREDGQVVCYGCGIDLIDRGGF